MPLHLVDATLQRRWVELMTQADADAEGRAMQHAVARHFQEDHTAASGARYFSLRSFHGASLVTVRIDPTPGAPPSRHVTVGLRNQNPFPAYSQDVAVLGRKLGVTLDESSYPYPGYGLTIG
jgi:hypothetical protein